MYMITLKRRNIGEIKKKYSEDIIQNLIINPYSYSGKINRVKFYLQRSKLFMLIKIFKKAFFFFTPKKIKMYSIKILRTFPRKVI